MKVSFSPADPRTKARFHWARHHWLNNKHQQNLLCSWLSILESCEHKLRRRPGWDKEGHWLLFLHNSSHFSICVCCKKNCWKLYFFCSVSSWPKLSPPTDCSPSLFFFVVSSSATINCHLHCQAQFLLSFRKNGFSVSDWSPFYYRQRQSFLKNNHISS